MLRQPEVDHATQSCTLSYPDFIIIISNFVFFGSVFRFDLGIRVLEVRQQRGGAEAKEGGANLRVPNWVLAEGANYIGVWSSSKKPSPCRVICASPIYDSLRLRH